MRPEPTDTPGGKARRWIVNLQFSGCPSASDWFAMQEHGDKGGWEMDLPSRCFLLKPGDFVVTPAKGARQTVSNKGHDYEKAATENGVEFWTDGMDNMSLTPI